MYNYKQKPPATQRKPRTFIHNDDLNVVVLKPSLRTVYAINDLKAFRKGTLEEPLTPEEQRIEEQRIEEEKERKREIKAEKKVEKALKKEEESTQPVGLEWGKKLTQARVIKNMTQKEFASAIQERVSVLQTYERGTAIPNRKVISKMERVIGKKL